MGLQRVIARVTPVNRQFTPPGSVKGNGACLLFVIGDTLMSKLYVGFCNSFDARAVRARLTRIRSNHKFRQTAVQQNTAPSDRALSRQK
jgi:hypothetical protein